jgi:hypothetical protein
MAENHIVSALVSSGLVWTRPSVCLLLLGARDDPGEENPPISLLVERGELSRVCSMRFAGRGRRSAHQAS